MAVLPGEIIRVLLVDDEPSFRLLLRKHLERDGCRVAAEAGDLANTYTLAETHQPHVILLDLVLGSERGIDAIGPLARLVPTTMIAILTGLAPEDEEATLRSAGAFTYYEKAMFAELTRYLRDDLRTFYRALDGEDVVAPSAITRRR